MAEKAINKTKAILFDLDGTLAQTMEFHYDAWRKSMLHYGIDLAPEDYYPLEGTNVYELAKKLFGLYNLNGFDEKELVNNKEKYFSDSRGSISSVPSRCTQTRLYNCELSDSLI